MFAEVSEPDVLVADPERIVVESCAAGTPAVVTLRERSGGVRGCFSAFRRGEIEIELADPAPELPEGAACHVAFLRRGQAVFFEAPLLRLEENSGRSFLWLPLPECITEEFARGAFRVPADDEAADVTIVLDDGSPAAARLANLSLTGALVEFTEAMPALFPEQVLELHLPIDGNPVRLAAVVRRLDATSAAFSFPDAVSDGLENPVRRAVAALERSWHARLRR